LEKEKLTQNLERKIQDRPDSGALIEKGVLLEEEQ